MIALVISPKLAAFVLDAIRDRAWFTQSAGRTPPDGLDTLVAALETARSGQPLDSSGHNGAEVSCSRGRPATPGPMNAFAMTRPEAARRLGVSERTLRRQVASGQLQEVRVGRRSMIPASEVVRILEAR